MKSDPKYIFLSQQLHQTSIWTKTRLVQSTIWSVAYLDRNISGLVRNLLGNFLDQKIFDFFFLVSLFFWNRWKNSEKNNKRIKGFRCKQWLMLMEFVINKPFLEFFSWDLKKSSKSQFLRENINILDIYNSVMHITISILHGSNTLMTNKITQQSFP